MGPKRKDIKRRKPVDKNRIVTLSTPPWSPEDVDGVLKSIEPPVLWEINLGSLTFFLSGEPLAGELAEFDEPIQPSNKFDNRF